MIVSLLNFLYKALLDNQNKLVELDECVILYNDRLQDLRLETAIAKGN
jgi:hypothetical protein